MRHGQFLHVLHPVPVAVAVASVHHLHLLQSLGELHKRQALSHHETQLGERQGPDEMIQSPGMHEVQARDGVWDI